MPAIVTDIPRWFAAEYERCSTNRFGQLADGTGSISEPRQDPFPTGIRQRAALMFFSKRDLPSIFAINPFATRMRPATAGRRAPLAALVALAAAWATTAVAAPPLPERYTGVWVQGDCDDATRVRLVNSLGIIDILEHDGEPHLQITAIEATTPESDHVRVDLRTNGGDLVESRLAVTDGRLGGFYRRCDAPPPPTLWALGEVVTLFEVAGELHRRCRGDSGARCVLDAFRALDVSDDGVLREAEIARVLRVAGFFVGYATTETNLVAARRMLMPSAVGGMLAPTVAAGMVANYDYDGDGGLTLDELLEDRGDRAGALAALASAETVAADLSLDAAVGFMRELAAPLFGGLATP
jgi:hypothetical protein